MKGLNKNITRLQQTHHPQKVQRGLQLLIEDRLKDTYISTVLQLTFVSADKQKVKALVASKATNGTSDSNKYLTQTILTAHFEFPPLSPITST